MPVEYEIFDDDRIIIVHYIGALKPEDLDNAVGNHVLPYINSHTPETAHVIYDVLRLEIEFPDFIKYITIAGKRREQGLIPDNLVQHFVGSNAWATNFRTWIYRKFNATISSFESVEAALNYIRSQAEKAPNNSEIVDNNTQNEEK